MMRLFFFFCKVISHSRSLLFVIVLFKLYCMYKNAVTAELIQK